MFMSVGSAFVSLCRSKDDANTDRRGFLPIQPLCARLSEAEPAAFRTAFFSASAHVLREIKTTISL
jgi:hypothetical protein